MNCRTSVVPYEHDHRRVPPGVHRAAVDRSAARRHRRDRHHPRSGLHGYGVWSRRWQSSGLDRVHGIPARGRPTRRCRRRPARALRARSRHRTPRTDHPWSSVRSLREGVDTSTPTGRAVTSIMATIAELELELGKERRAASREARVARGLAATKPMKLDAAQQKRLLRLYQQGEPVSELTTLFGISRSTLFRTLKVLKQQPAPA